MINDVLFSVNPGNGQTIYRQMVEQMKAALAAGRLKPGDKLPTHRDLAKELVVAPLTIKKAYDLLQLEGLIQMSQGRGTFVSERASTISQQAHHQLEARIEGMVHQAKIMGIPQAELQKLIKKYCSKME